MKKHVAEMLNSILIKFGINCANEAHAIDTAGNKNVNLKKYNHEQ